MFIINEKKLIKLVKRKGDQAAAGELVQLYYRELYIYVYKQTQNEELSKDLTQEIFISMLKSIDRYEESKASFRTWLYKIASNKIIDTYRSTYYKYVTVVDEIEEGTERLPSMEELFVLQEETDEILEIIDTFEMNIQQILRMKIFGEMTFLEISSLLECPESTIKTKYYAAVRKIKRILEVKHSE